MSLFLYFTLSLQTEVSAVQAPVVIRVPEEIEAMAGIAEAAPDAGAAVQAAPVPAWVLRKEAPNAVLRAETEVRRMRVRVLVEAGAHIEVTRHPARIGVSHRL